MAGMLCGGDCHGPDDLTVDVIEPVAAEQVPATLRNDSLHCEIAIERMVTT
jgi:hypothetical protein